MAYEQQAGRANVESSAINYLTDKDKKKTTVKTDLLSAAAFLLKRMLN